MKINPKFEPNEKQIIAWIKSMEKSLTEKIDYKKFVPIVSAEAARVFVTQGYGSWSPLSKRYAAKKAKVRPHVTILRLTDEYFSAATQVGHVNNLMEATKKGLVYGVQAFTPNYPLFHEVGTSRMPARPVWENLIESEDLQTKVIVAFRKQIQENIAKEGRRFFNV